MTFIYAIKKKSKNRGNIMFWELHVAENRKINVFNNKKKFSER